MRKAWSGLNAALGSSAAAGILQFYYYRQFSLLMQSPPDQQRPTYPVNRERPLQKSLVLPDHFSPQNHNAPKAMPLIPDFAYNPMKRSSTALTDNPTPPNINSQYGGLYSFTAGSAPSSSTMLPSQSFDQRAQSQHELLHHPGTSSLKNLTTMARSNIVGEADTKNFYKEKRQNLELKLSSAAQGEPADVQHIIGEVTAQLKKDHLPALVRSIRKEFLDDLHHLRVDFQIFKDEVKAHQADTQEMLLWFKTHEKATPPRKEHLSKSPTSHKEPELEWMEAQFSALEERMVQYQAKVYDSINLLNSKFEAEFKSMPKSSAIRSSFPPFSLEYKESFAIASTVKAFPEITVSQTTYYMDKSGFLLDQEGFYLLDGRGTQLRLEERHLRLLEHHKIIAR